jgi:hypothetical protein
MATFRYVGDEARLVSILPSGDTRRLEPDELFDVPDAHTESYECQPYLYELQEAAPKKAPAKKAGNN